MRKLCEVRSVRKVCIQLLKSACYILTAEQALALARNLDVSQDLTYGHKNQQVFSNDSISMWNLKIEKK